MKIFLGGEMDLFADKIISPLRRQLSGQIEILLSDKPQDYYSKDITHLCIISTCVSEEFLRDSNWKERVRYSKKDGWTDIRLNINHEKLLSSSKGEQCKLYFDHIIESIQRFKLKYPRLDFQAEKFIGDLRDVFLTSGGFPIV